MRIVHHGQKLKLVPISNCIMCGPPAGMAAYMRKVLLDRQARQTRNHIGALGALLGNPGSEKEKENGEEER